MIDNDPTDATAEITRRHGARVVVEPREGVVPARQAGFVAARGKVIHLLTKPPFGGILFFGTFGRLGSSQTIRESGDEAILQATGFSEPAAGPLR